MAIDGKDPIFCVRVGTYGLTAGGRLWLATDNARAAANIAFQIFLLGRGDEARENRVEIQAGGHARPFIC